MSRLLDIMEATLSFMFELACKATLREESRPRWFNYSLAVCYYLLPVMFIVSLFISWKIAMIVTGAFVVSLLAGAVTEADDMGASR